mgnify:CR=1 FL=1
MNTRFLYSFIAIGLVFFLSACSKPRKNDFFDIKWEIITTAEITGPFSPIFTKAGLQISNSHSNFTTGKIWEFSTDFETSHRPIEIYLNAQNMRLKDHGTVTLNIYVNNSLKATSTRESAIFDGKQTVITEPIGYYIY